MKSFNALTPILLVAIGFGATVRADDPAPVDDIPQVEAEQYGSVDGAYLPPVAYGAYADFPPYQRGFTSYRGLGFMGSCCEQTSCCAQHAWDGYCEAKGSGRKNLFHGWADKLHGCRPKSVCCPSAKCCDTGCGQKGCPEPTCCDTKPWHGLFGKLGCGLHQADCCDPCGDPCCDEVGGKCGVVSPRRQCKLNCLRGHWGGLWHGTPTDMYGECCEPVQGKGMWAPADVQSPQAAPVPAPEPTAEPIEELPEPTVTTDYVPEFPDFSTQDRSATRHELRRLTNAFMSL